MSQKPHHFRIGLFVLGGVALVVLSLFAFGLRKSFEKKHTVLTYVPGHVEGLTIGSPVKLKGVVIGQVNGLYFSWNRYPGTKAPCVIVEFDVKDDVSPVMNLKPEDFASAVKSTVDFGLRVIVKSQGITGTSFLELEILDPAKNPPFAYDWKTPRYPYIPSAPSDLGRILGAVDRTLAKLQTIDTDKIGRQIESTLAAAERTIEKFGRIDVEGISKGTKGTLADASATVLEVRGLATDARAKVKGLQTEEVSQDVRKALAGLEATNDKIQVAVDRLSVVDVRELNDTLADLRLAARGLAEALSTIRKQPSQLLLGGAPPAASVLEQPAAEKAGTVEKEERK